MQIGGWCRGLWCGLGPPNGVPHGHRFPQGGQHLVPVGDAHATGLGADDHVAHVFTSAVIGVLCHSDPQREILQGQKFTESNLDFSLIHILHC